MNTESLETIARALVAPGRGILAADESAGTCEKRFSAVGIESNEENRRQYREILVETPGNEDVLSGIIFFDETFWQKNNERVFFRDSAGGRGILPGIKLDEGLVDLPGFPGEKISKGLDTLPERVRKYADAGAKFAKWRSVITIGKTDEGVIPTEECIRANAFVLARYARICQDAGLVPIVEPEVLFDGTHSAKECEEAMARTLDELFIALRAYRVHLPGVVLKTSMVLPGKDSGLPIDPEDVSERTARVLLEYVPPDIGGVVFLSGGQTSADSFRNLDAIAKKGPYHWGVTFSYSRALQDPVLKYWAKKRDDTAGAKTLFGEQLKTAALASEGKLKGALDKDAFVSGSQDS